jgi:uncharacterized C2H2 Zn-finger protein
MFHCTIGPQSYAEIYESCTGFPVLNVPDLPNRICNQCESRLIDVHNFRLSLDIIENRILQFQSQFEMKSEEVPGEANDVSMLEEDIAVDDADDENTYEIEEVYEEEEFLMESKYEDEEFLEQTEDSQQIEEPAVPETKETFCQFLPSPDNPKNVKCVSCSDCELEKIINESKPDGVISVTCECLKVFKNRRSFLKHFTSIHLKRETSYNCRSCEEVFTSMRSRITHEAKTHSLGLKFSCGSCDKKFYRSDHAREHEKSCNKVVDASEKFFSCAVCLFTFQREDSYRKHLETAHVGAKEDDKRYVERAEEYAKKFSANRSGIDETSPGVTCSECQKVFLNEQRLSKHVSLFHSNHVWACEQCDAVFVHRSTKVSHMSTVHGVRKPFECSECNFSCFKRDRFNAHLEKHKNPDKKFPCPICQQEFNSYNTMTLHRAKHLTKNTFECVTCSKQFLDKRNYNVHMKLHTGENLFHCSVCMRGFNRKDHLQKHQKRKNHF